MTYEPFPAASFPSHPEWPVYEAPARWYVRKIEHETEDAS